MKAFLYVAGRAGRLGDRTQGRPKVLLEFGGRSLLERHVMILAQLHVPQLCVVTGFERQQIAARLPALQSRYGVELVELHNPDFTEGSALSMHASLPELERVTDSALIMDGDVLYDVRLLERLVQSAHPTALLMDRQYSTADDDPVLVPIRNGRPFELLKKWRGEADVVGESIGFMKVALADLPLLIRETQRRATGPGRADSYDEILRALALAGRYGAEDITGLPWTEIDFPEDLAYATDVILPRLVDDAVRPGR